MSPPGSMALPWQAGGGALTIGQPEGARIGVWGAPQAEEGPKPPRVSHTPCTRRPQSPVLSGPPSCYVSPHPGDTLTGGSQGSSGLLAHVTPFVFSTPFCQNHLGEESQGPCGPGGGSRGARWEEREEGSRANVSVLTEVSRGPAVPGVPGPVPNDPGDTASCQRICCGRLSGSTPTTTFIPSDHI